MIWLHLSGLEGKILLRSWGGRLLIVNFLWRGPRVRELWVAWSVLASNPWKLGSSVIYSQGNGFCQQFNELGSSIFSSQTSRWECRPRRLPHSSLVRPWAELESCWDHAGTHGNYQIIVCVCFKLLVLCNLLQSSRELITLTSKHETQALEKVVHDKDYRAASTMPPVPRAFCCMSAIRE